MVGSFVGLIAIGTALLWLPISTDSGGTLSLHDALFTSTAAVTVTGQGSVDISRLTVYGELVILGLVQVGGFGIMTMGSMLAMVASHRLGLKQRMLTQVEMGTVDIGEIRFLVLALLKIMAVVEGTLALVLFVRFWTAGYEDHVGRAAYSAVFHSITAFNNAGVSLYSDNLARFVGDPVVVFGVSFAFIIGGLGFPILVEVARRGRDRWRTGRVVRPWTIHTKITLLATAILLVFGPVVVLLFEWTNPATLGPLDTFDKLLAGWFQGVSPRTAGFNTVAVGGMNEPTLLVISTLMFIGAGPASTSGGIKATTFAVLGFVLWSEVRGDGDVNVFGRRVPPKVIRQGLTIALLAVGLVVGASLLLMSTEGLSLTPALFESTSAFGTAGLTTGATASMGAFGELILALVMFAGRVGPVTLITALALRDRAQSYRYPEERPIIG